MKTLLKGALALGVAAAALSTPASATHDWGGYHWARTANPFLIRLGDNVDSKWDGYLVTTNIDWTKSGVLDTVIAAGATRARQCRGTSGRVEVCNAAYGSTGWLGIASITIASGNHITSGTVKLNDTYFNTAQYNAPKWRNMVMCQEVGHTFGLGHVNENFNDKNTGSCMDYSNDPGRDDGFGDNQHPNAHDYDFLASKYAHFDTTTTIGAVRPGTAGLEIGNSPKSWGRAVRFRRDGRPDTYVRNDGPGQMTVTHVFWVPGMGPEHSHED